MSSVSPSRACLTSLRSRGGSGASSPPSCSASLPGESCGCCLPGCGSTMADGACSWNSLRSEPDQVLENSAPSDLGAAPSRNPHSLRASQYRFSMVVRRTDAVHHGGDRVVDGDQVGSRFQLADRCLRGDGLFERAFVAEHAGSLHSRDPAECGAALPPQRAAPGYLLIPADP